MSSYQGSFVFCVCFCIVKHRAGWCINILFHCCKSSRVVVVVTIDIYIYRPTFYNSEQVTAAGRGRLGGANHGWID